MRGDEKKGSWERSGEWKAGGSKGRQRWSADRWGQRCRPTMGESKGCTSSPSGVVHSGRKVSARREGKGAEGVAAHQSAVVG